MRHFVRLLTGPVILVVAWLVPAPVEVRLSLGVAGLVSFIFGLHGFVEDPPDVRVPTWLGLTIIIALGGIIPAFVALLWVAHLLNLD
ncbi:MAG TPA: hypothetical protein VFG04_30805 [Planctomycetaceae bacterium]|jgi:hypothetical protein|nr:hypothetical protein [Planctomycetaceae bacterium]